MQAPYAVHADISGGDGPMRDSARFHFGFTVPFLSHPSAIAVIEAVAESRGDLGIFRLDQGASSGAWWRILTEAGQLRRSSPGCLSSSAPATRPARRFSSSRSPSTDAAVRDVVIYAAQFERWHEGAGETLDASAARWWRALPTPAASRN